MATLRSILILLNSSFFSMVMVLLYKLYLYYLKHPLEYLYYLYTHLKYSCASRKPVHGYGGSHTADDRVPSPPPSPQPPTEIRLRRARGRHEDVPWGVTG